MSKLRMEVVYVIAHLVITLAIIAGYLYTVVIGEANNTLEVALIAIIGYWFGAVGKENFAKLTDRKGSEKG